MNFFAGTVIVYWIAVSALHSSTVPSEEQDPRDLVPMTLFTHTNWQIGDRALLPQGFKVTVEEAGGVSDEAGVPDSNNEEPALLEGSSASTEEPTPPAEETVEGTADEVIAPKQRKTNKLRKVTKKERKASRKEKTVEKAALIVNTRTRVDILWQDGTKSTQVNSCSLVPVEHLGDHDFWPEQYVLEQGPDGDELDNEVRRVGEHISCFHLKKCRQSF